MKNKKIIKKKSEIIKISKSPKISLSFRQIGEVYRLKTMRNTTDFRVNSDFSKEEVDKLINSKNYNCLISGNC